MRKALFLMSHLGSGYETLVNILIQDPRIDSYITEQIYDHPEKLSSLTKSIHRQDNAFSIYLDVLLYNHSMTCKPLCKTENFVFFIREPSSSIREILERHPNYSLDTATRYYCYRLRGIYEYSRRVAGSIVLTLDDLREKNLRGLENYLGLKSKFVVGPIVESSEHLEIAEAQDSYERYLRHIREKS